MKTAIAIFMTIHGLIHLLGFLKAYNLAELKDLKLSISKKAGLLWLLSFALFTATVNLYIAGSYYYIGMGFTGILISQVLIIQSWEDAKFGSIPNILLGILLLISL